MNNIQDNLNPSGQQLPADLETPVVSPAPVIDTPATAPVEVAPIPSSLDRIAPASPISEPAAIAPVASQPTEQAPTTVPSGSHTVLLVEDDPFLSSLLKTKLQKSGISVTLATDGEQALETLKTLAPDLILLDLILPKKSGFEVLESIQSDPQLNKIAVIILSNLGQDTDITKGKGLGAVEYFIKAKTSIDELVKKIEGFLETRQI